MTQYFLFGTEACLTVSTFGQDDTDKLVDIISKGIFGVYIWDEHSTPNEILYEFDGWGDYMEIEEELYTKLLEL